MESKKLIHPENLSNPIILNNYSIQNLIISPLNIKAYNNSQINTKKKIC